MPSSDSSATPASQCELPDMQTPSSRRMRTLQVCFCCAVVALAIFQLSENTVDVDLWGHVVFGEAMLKSHAVPRTDVYSWTAAGQPWVDHECLAEVLLGGAHALMGGGGLFLLKLTIGLLSFAITLRLGLDGLGWPEKLVAWGVAALAVVELSYGFAARPQIFTALFMALELVLLNRIHSGARLWWLGMPLMFALWINTHGGVLAGFGLLGLAVLASTAQSFFTQSRKMPLCAADLSFKTIVVLWLALVASGAALFVNPWKGELIRWLIGSVMWLRPEIQEWNPTPLGWDHAALFALIFLAAFAWIFTRRRRVWWQIAVCAAFSALAMRSVRNAPLCALVILALTPPHLSSALVSFRSYLSRYELLCRKTSFQKSTITLLILAVLGIAMATFGLHKKNPFTMEIPSDRFPNGAVAFLSERQLHGKMLVFFDWGEMVIFHLPDCPPSLDGRLDTCYSRELIAAHWRFYNGEPFDEKILSVDEADMALLPVNLAGAAGLAKRPGWTAVYYDQTAVVLVRNRERFAKLAGLSLPVEGPKNAGGREAFPNYSPRRK